MKTGFYNDGQSTRKVRIIDETISGKYVCREFVIMIRPDGSQFTLTTSEVMLIPKNEVVDIKEGEELSNA